ncbi:hypothetical protein C8R45DRAFT_1112386 [Mycena sanguinolenta]|nr:hypothetical protein C8R45DRAFT_1112386 [Mycena sanguinolenta]
MFNKVTLIFLAFGASTILGAPIPDAQEATACNTEKIASNIATVQAIVQDFQSRVLSDLCANATPPPSLLSATDTANTASDFATLTTTLQLLINIVNTGIGSGFQDGTESSDDFALLEMASNTQSFT